MNNNEDIRIVTAVNQKDGRQWEAFYRRFYTPLCIFVSKMSLPDDVTEDIVQEIFISLWEGKRTFSDIRELTNYLYRACYNNALMSIRNMQANDTFLEAFAEEEQENRNDYYRRALKEELLRRLYIRIDHLPTEQRRMMLLRIEGKSWDEIAESLGVSINTIKTQRSRIFKSLRSEMAKNEKKT